MSTAHVGGLSHLVKVARSPTSTTSGWPATKPSDVSPVSVAAAVHLGTAIPNFGIQEHVAYPGQVAEVFRHSYQFSDGWLTVGDEPGLGVDINEEAAARYPYERAYLPVNRNTGGSVFDW